MNKQTVFLQDKDRYLRGRKCPNCGKRKVYSGFKNYCKECNHHWVGFPKTILEVRGRSNQ